MTLTRNKAVDHLRSRGRHSRFEDKIRSALHAHEILHPTRERGETTYGMVRTAVRNLPPDQKKVVEMSFIENLSHQEISTSIQEPLGTVKTRVRLSLRKLYDSLKKRVTY